MDKVKKLVEAGASIPMAIKDCLSLPVGEFADKYDIPRPTMSDAINGARRPTEQVVAALITELGGTEPEWRELLWLAGKPVSAAPSA